MKFETLSLVAGTTACNAKCRYCCAKFTAKKQPVSELDTRNLKTCIQLANRSNINTALITGWGEPLLYPDHIEGYCDYLSYGGPPLIELQTNGILLDKEMVGKLKNWGITTIAISCVRTDQKKNEDIFGKAYKDIKTQLSLVKEAGLTSRATIVGIKDGIRDYPSLKRSVEELSPVADQITWKPVVTNDESIALTIQQHNQISMFIEECCTPLYNLPFGGTVYDYEGQNICITNCLTTQPDNPVVRQLIYLPNGKVTYDWKYEGAVILS